MLELTEYVVDGELPPDSHPAIFCVRAPGKPEAIGAVTAEDFPAGPLDRPSLFRRLLGHRTPKKVRRSVVRARDGGGVVVSLQHLDPVFSEVDRVYGPDGTLAGRCVSFGKSTTRAGFRVLYADGRPFGEVPFAGSAEDRRSLLDGSGRTVGSLHRLGGEPTTGGPPVRYAVSVGDAADEEPAGRLFLLASAVALALADDRLKRALARV